MKQTETKNIITIETLNAFSDARSFITLLYDNKNNLTKDDFATLCELLKRSFDEQASGICKDFVLISYYKYIFMLYELCDIMQNKETQKTEALQQIKIIEVYILQKACDYIKSTNN